MTTISARETQNTEQQNMDWVRAQFQKANEYLASKGIIPENVALAESRYLPPYVAVWKLNAQDKNSYWVISGDLPTDHLALNAAANAREALRAFSLHWQLKAQQIINLNIQDTVQQNFADLLIEKAQALYAVFDNESLWKNSAL